MSVKLKCPACGQSVKVTLQLAGKKGKCPGCQQSIRIPSAEKLQALEAKLSAAKPVSTPAAPPTPDPSPSSDDPFSDLSNSSWDDGDFDFGDPAPVEEGASNPFASPLAEYKKELAAQSRGNKGYAGLWPRFVAAFVDGFLLSIVGNVIAVVFNLMIESRQGDNDAVFNLLLMNTFLLIIVQWLYYALQECSASQATIGKRAMGLRVTDLNGQPISFVQATARYFCKLLSYLTLMVGYFMIAFTSRKQGLHDMIARTLVVKS